MAHPEGSARSRCRSRRRSARKSPACASTRNLDMVRSIGADHVIDYTKEDFTQGEQRLRPDPRQRLHSLPVRPPTCARPRPGSWCRTGDGSTIAGSPVAVASSAARSRFRFGSQTLRTFVDVDEAATDLLELKQLIEAGKVTPVIDRTYPLERNGSGDRPRRRRVTLAGRPSSTCERTETAARPGAPARRDPGERTDRGGVMTAARASSQPYAARLTVDYPERLDRLTTFFGHLGPPDRSSS